MSSGSFFLLRDAIVTRKDRSWKLPAMFLDSPSSKNPLSRGGTVLRYSA